MKSVAERAVSCAVDPKARARGIGGKKQKKASI